MATKTFEIKAVNLVTKTSKAGKPYQVAVVEYRDDSGKLQERNIMPFGSQKNAFDSLSGITPGTYSITMEKNDQGYWDWVGVGAPNTEASTPARASSTPTPRNTYETPEERALRQKFIIRQSSLTNAIALYELDKKKTPTVQDVIQVAKQFEDFVFGKETQGVGGPEAELIAMEDDIPL